VGDALMEWDNNTHESSRTILLHGDVDGDMAEKLLQGLHHLTSISKRPVTLLINSDGGRLDEAFSMTEAIRHSQCDVLGVVMGRAYSAAALILQACDKRFMTPGSEMMIHEGTASLGAMHPAEFKVHSKSIMKDNRRANVLIAERSGLSLAKVKKLSRFASFLSSSECLRLGLIDGIATHKKS
jgi:ATP-dependent Clp protease protease subunit